MEVTYVAVVLIGRDSSMNGGYASRFTRLQRFCCVQAGTPSISDPAGFVVLHVLWHFGCPPLRSSKTGIALRAI